MNFTSETKEAELIGIQKQIAEIDFSLPDAYLKKAALDEQICRIMKDRTSNAVGYDRIKAARDELHAQNVLMRTKSMIR